MSTAVSIEEAGGRLAELIASLAPSDEVVITQDHRPVAKLCPVAGPAPQASFGRCKGMLHILVEDDEHLDAFRDYMP